MVKPAKFLAVRGPQTRKNLLAQGYDVPEIYGDPALLLPKYYHPKIEKSYRLGIVPHYNDYKTVYKMYKANPEVLVINLMTNHIEETTNLFLQCERIVSSSLHGLIISHAYQIPAVWVEFSKNLFGDGIKFQDYFESIDIISYQAVFYDKPVAIETFMELFKTDTNLPSLEKIEQVQKDLMSVCPFV